MGLTPNLTNSLIFHRNIMVNNGNYKFAIGKDGTKVRVLLEGDDFIPTFPENIDCKISNMCDIGCSYCHENSTKDGLIADFKKMKKFFNSLSAGTEIALGGGALSLIPREEFEEILTIIHNNSVYANITVNQSELEKDPEFLDFIVKQHKIGHIKGVGVSYKKESTLFIKLNSLLKGDLVIHTINGILTEDDIKFLSNRNFKILILGYKNFRRGINYYDKFQKVLENNKKYLKDNISNISKRFRTVSFDCLAVEQLELQKIVPEKMWNKLYMGDDGKFTMYVDLVEEKYGANSTSSEDSRDTLDFEKMNKEYIFEIFKGVRENG